VSVPIALSLHSIDFDKRLGTGVKLSRRRQYKHQLYEKFTLHSAPSFVWLKKVQNQQHGIVGNLAEVNMS
jgi:hypothetical protein